jgi:ankyrin repeat protein
MKRFNYLFALIICLSFIVSTYSSSIFHSGLSADELGAKVVKAIYLDGAEKVQGLLERGANVNFARTEDGETPLLASISTFKTDLVELLLAQDGIEVNAFNSYGENALISAAKTGQVRTIEMLLNRPGIKVNAIDPLTGQNALMFACKESKADAANVFLANGDRRIDAVRVLLESEKCDLTHVDHFGKTALTSSFNPEIHEMVFEYMASKCSSVDELEALNADLKRFELEIEYLDAAKHGDYDRLLSALDRGVNVNATDGENQSAMCLETSGSEAIFNLLISRGINVNSPSALLKHSHDGNEKMVKLLLKNPSTIATVTDARGCTALMLASLTDNPELVKCILLDGRIDACALNTFGSCALDFAACPGFSRRNTREIIELLTAAIFNHSQN